MWRQRITAPLFIPIAHDHMHKVQTHIGRGSWCAGEVGDPGHLLRLTCAELYRKISGSAVSKGRERDTPWPGLLGSASPICGVPVPVRAAAAAAVVKDVITSTAQ